MIKLSFFSAAVVLAGDSAPGKGARTALVRHACRDALILLFGVPVGLTGALRAPVCVRCIWLLFEDEKQICCTAVTRSAGTTTLPVSQNYKF